MGKGTKEKTVQGQSLAVVKTGKGLEKKVYDAELVDPREWKWYGKAGHFIMGDYCRFHLCTQIGQYLISTVGELWLDSHLREVTAELRGIKLQRQGDARDEDYMRKVATNRSVAACRDKKCITRRWFSRQKGCVGVVVGCRK